MDDGSTECQVCEKCQANFDELLKEVLLLRNERKKFEDLYKAKCRQELRNKAELLHAKDLFERQLYELKKEDDLGLLQYLSCRVAVQDKVIRENSRELDELRRRCGSARVGEQRFESAEAFFATPAAPSQGDNGGQEPPLNTGDKKESSSAGIRLSKLEVIRRERQSVDRQDRYSQQAERPRPVALRRNGSLRDSSGIIANQHDVIKTSQDRALKTHNTIFFARPCEKKYVASLQNALRTATQEKALLERRVAIQMDSATTHTSPRQHRLSTCSNDEESTSALRLGVQDEMLLDALKDTNEALRSELTRLAPFETQANELTDQVERLKRIESDLQSKINDLQTENEHLLKQVEISQKQMQQQELNARQMCSDYEKNLTASKQRLKMLLQERDALHALQQESKDSIARLKQTNWRMGQENLASNKIKNELKTANEGYIAEINRLKLANQQLLSQITDPKATGPGSQCLNCKEKEALIGNQSRQIELLRKLAYSTTRTTVTTGTNTVLSATKSGSSLESKKPEAAPAQTAIRRDGDLSAVVNTSGLANPFKSRGRSVEMTDEQTNLNTTASQKELTGALSGNSILDLSREFRALRESIQVSERRRKQLEKDYERKLLHLSINDEELNRLRRV